MARSSRRRSRPAARRGRVMSCTTQRTRATWPERCSATPEEWVAYRIAWVGGCALFHRPALDAVGGFSFARLPVPHAGEDVLVQLRVMRRFGGQGSCPAAPSTWNFPRPSPRSR